LRYPHTGDEQVALEEDYYEEFDEVYVLSVSHLDDAEEIILVRFIISYFVRHFRYVIKFVTFISIH
jgi:hypothetical protein